MPSSIPYDPSLVLGNVITTEALQRVEQIAAAQSPADAAHEDLNALLTSKRSLEMTKTELQNLGIDTAELEKAMDTMDASIGSSAAEYATKKVESEAKIKDLRAQIRTVHEQVESPLDYVQTQIKTLPLSADSLSLDVQYFSRDSNQQDSSSFASAVSSFVSASTKWMGTKASSQISAAAQKQVSRQAQRHDIQGTLVLSASCSHRNASVLAPFILNVDKGFKVWNRLFKDDILDANDPQGIANVAQAGGAGTNKFSIISGQTVGSSFVGMVHVMNSTDTTVSEKLSSYASSMQAQMDAGSWYAKVSGGFGVNSTIGDNVKNLLSTQNVTSHVTMTCMGVIPTIVASDVSLGVQQFAKFDPQSSMEAIATLQNATGSDQNSVKEAADAARTGGQMMSMRANDIKSALSALSDIEKTTNKILDINSLMTALDDYLKKAQAGDCGVPINYYLKDITKDMLAEMWVAKHMPGKYMAITYDDNTQNAGESSGEAAA